MTTKEELENAYAQLRKLLRPGDTVHSIIRSVSRSGMSRRIDFYVFKTEKGHVEPYYLTGYMDGLGIVKLSRNRQGGRVDGCGMDMAFHCVYSLARALWRDGVPCMGPSCLSNDHSNGAIRPETKKAARGIIHSDSGYALRSKIL